MADSSFLACGLSIVVVGLSNFGKYIVQQLINQYNKKKNLYNHSKYIENVSENGKKDIRIIDKKN